MIRWLTRQFARHPPSHGPPSKMVAVVVPLSNRPDLTDDEQISMQHLRHFLGDYDTFLIAPRGLRINYGRMRVSYFSKKFFGSAAAHNRLLYWPQFYRRFIDYKYILFYQLDALALSDQLTDWCATDLDYIGPPWIICADTPWVKNPRVGNGGFALLKVASALSVLYNRYKREPMQYWKDLFTRNGRYLSPVIDVMERVSSSFPNMTTIRALLDEWEAMEDPGKHGRHNDVFWSDQAKDYYSDFKVASLEDGLRFGFEAAPRKCFELNHRQLPFGCHAWPRYDRAFWEPFLLTTDLDKAKSPDN